MKLLTSDQELDELSKDAGIIVMRPAAAFLAEGDGDVLEVLEEAKRRHLPVTPRGGGTSIPSQAVGRGVILLQRNERVEVGNDDVSSGPSVVKADLNARLEVEGKWVPPDPSSYRSCTLGGMVANNSSGTRTFKYGSTVDYVEELTVVLPEEGTKVVRRMSTEDALHADPTTRRVADLILQSRKDIERERPRVTKNSCGYRLEKVLVGDVFDLPKLFVGSEGTLGVTTNIVFETRPKPAERALLIVEVSLPSLDEVASMFRGLRPSAVELVDKAVFREAGREERLQRISRTEEELLVFAEFDGSASDVAASLRSAAESPIAGYEPLALTDPADMAAAWDVRNETLTLATEIRKGGRVLLPGVEDLVAPPERLGDVVRLVRDQFERKGLGYISYGHAGDANLHMRPFLDPGSSSEMSVLKEIMEECFEAVWKMGGSMTGEHGDGMLRADYVRRQYPKTYPVMKEIRTLYDPKGLLNPGVKIV